MANPQPFLLDGKTYDVHVTELKRLFSVLDSDKSGRTMDGNMYRDPIGTFYNYTMTVAPIVGNNADMDAFWEAISQPVASHKCVFPYGQEMLTQEMYVTGGEQGLVLMHSNGNQWGEITVNFIAMSPQVMP